MTAVINNSHDALSYFVNNPALQDPDYFVIMQVIKRRKDPGNSSMAIGSTTLYQRDIRIINGIDSFLSTFNICKSIADINGGRVYLGMNVKSYRRTAFDMLKYLSETTYAEQYFTAPLAFIKCAARHNVKGHRKFLIDIDWDNINDFDKDEIKNLVQLHFKEAKLPPPDLVSPTLNGMHVIMNPAQPSIIESIMNKINNITFSLHKDNAHTLIYFNPNIYSK